MLKPRAALRLILLTVTIASFGGCRAGMSKTDTDAFSEYVDARGAIRFPAGFRTKMVHLGSWFVPEPSDASGFHDVYTEASTVAAFRQTGEFPDGATLVKEIRAANTGDYTTGANVSYANDEIKQWFVMVKNRKGRFGDNPLWEKGWGWALFKPDDPSKNVATSFEKDCMGCHIPAQKTDWVYVEAYPTLGGEDAKGQ